jgi:hypothetical protein
VFADEPRNQVGSGERSHELAAQPRHRIELTPAGPAKLVAARRAGA